MSNYRKVHITLTPENFQAVRECAFDTETTISHVIDVLIEEYLVRKMPDGSSGDTTMEQKPNQPPERPAPSVAPEWSVSSLRLKK